MKTVTYDEEKWQLVPKEPTQEMTRPAFGVGVWTCNCKCGEAYSGGLSHNKTSTLYKKMLAEAPEMNAVNCGSQSLSDDILALDRVKLVEWLKDEISDLKEAPKQTQDSWYNGYIAGLRYVLSNIQRNEFDKKNNYDE